MLIFFAKSEFSVFFLLKCSRIEFEIRNVENTPHAALVCEQKEEKVCVFETCFWTSLKYSFIRIDRRNQAGVDWMFGWICSFIVVLLGRGV